MNRIIIAWIFSTIFSAAIGQRVPNILLLVSDDHSVPFLGAYGYPDLKTPNLDQLASEGTIYRNAHVTAPQCVLSRAGLMTGRNNVAIRMTRFSSPLPADIVTYPELLRKAGYFTGLVGRSFHLDGVRRNPSTAAIQDKYQLETFKIGLIIFVLMRRRIAYSVIIHNFWTGCRKESRFLFRCAIAILTGCLMPIVLSRIRR